MVQSGSIQLNDGHRWETIVLAHSMIRSVMKDACSVGVRSPATGASLIHVVRPHLCRSMLT
jgi:hypothetical protein